METVVCASSPNDRPIVQGRKGRPSVLIWQTWYKGPFQGLQESPQPKETFLLPSLFSRDDNSFYQSKAVTKGSPGTEEMGP